MLSGYFGRRHSEDSNKLCICDFNPFCRGTLGGAMDDMLDTLLTERSVMDEVDNDVEGDNTVIVIDDANTSNTTNNSVNIPDDLTLLIDDFYKPQTSERLKRVRKYIQVDEKSIRDYLKKILSTLSEALSLDEGLDRVRQLHESLIFTIPLQSTENSRKLGNCTNARELPILLSMPPGIENLGATCYLNTQLQCLAQNLVFVDGIMSWRPSTGNGGSDRMTSIMALFQALLLRMNSGPDSTVNTLEFSNALGLDHFEQQDPNEFSRLFLERMHDSFQSSSNNKNLADLLPRLFQGNLVYETTCLVCNTKSKRTEEFMDLNLPIVKRKSARSGTQRTIDSFCSKFDSDVQYCLDQYCREEILDGENKYLCSHCGDKCEARRAVAFKTLPPILNVQVSQQCPYNVVSDGEDANLYSCQLCRYVFNREKLIKTKLSDRVLLPLHLNVHAQTGSHSSESKYKYFLCAIMRHKGISAYSGHYVAEAMDWLSGQWFEFNDDNVIRLEDGPSNSFNPVSIDLEEYLTETITTNQTKDNSLVGSTDAYNMYYVEESFLAHCALERLRKGNDPRNEPDHFSDLCKERSRNYDELRQ
jgi:ubiquitin C-terminal hydrolase